MPMFPRRRRPAPPPPSSEGARGGSSWPPAGAGEADRAGPFWAKITGQATSTNRYAWTQLDDGDTAAFDAGLSEDFAATGTSDETGSPAYEINGCLDVPTDGSVRVRLYPAGDQSYFVFTYAPSSSTISSASTWKTPVRIATTVAGTLASDFVNGNTVDGVTIATGDRILIKDQASATANGIYVVASGGAPTRATDADSGTELLGATVAVMEGTVNKDRVFLCTANATITVGSTALNWELVGPRGFPAELTSVWDAGTGYSWKRQVQSGLSLSDTGETGNYAIAADGSTALTSGTKGWLEPGNVAGGTAGWIFTTPGGGSGTVTSVTLTQPSFGLTITDSGVAITTTGTRTFALANDLAALEALSSTGFAAHTGSDTWAERTLTAPAAGFTITNPAGVAGNPTFVLANDLNALEGLGSTGIAARTASDTWAQRTITGSSSITVADGNGVSGNPTISLNTSYLTVSGGFALTLTVTAITNVTFPTSGTLLSTTSAGIPIWVLYDTVTHADLAGVMSGAGNVTLTALPAKTAFFGAELRTRIAASGGGITILSVTIEIESQTFSGGVDGVTAGSRGGWFPNTAAIGSWVFDWDNTASVVMVFTNGDVNLDNLTAGEWDLYLCTALMP